MSTIVGIDDGECLVGTDRFLGERGSRDGSNEREAGQKAGRKDPGRIDPENHVDGFEFEWNWIIAYCFGCYFVWFPRITKNGDRLNPLRNVCIAGNGLISIGVSSVSFEWILFCLPNSDAFVVENSWQR